ncbi:MAG: AraC family transcriptional regulator [Ruminococcaceae bacterium]|nr:AraC family transcriptional regulator [Oscillospiraceae bacterium]
MKTVSLCDLGGQDLFFGRPEVFAESWVSRKAFGQYRDRSRPVSALFMVCTDIKVHFFGQERAALTAVQGDVIFIPKGVRYHVQVEGGTPNRIDTYTVNLDLKGETGEDVLLSESISRLCNNREGALQPHFQKLNEAAHNGDPGSLLRIKSELYLLLDALSATVAASPAAYYAIRSGIEALRAEWNQSRRIEEYAALCGISNTYFCRCFREWCGKSPVEYRNALRLSHAESMLRHTDMPIGEIAGLVGFEDPFYFSRIFARHVGCSPKAYRKR